MAWEPLNHQTLLTIGGAFLDHPLNLPLLFSTRESVDFEKMSGRNGRGGGRKLDLKLNLSPPIARRRSEESPSRSATMSPATSCVSSENIQEGYTSSPEATSMMLVGCPRCLMYVMLAEEYPKCPKCKSTVLLDVVHDDNSIKKTRKT